MARAMYGYFQVVTTRRGLSSSRSCIASLPLADQAKIAVHIWNTQGPKAVDRLTPAAAYKNSSLATLLM